MNIGKTQSVYSHHAEVCTTPLGWCGMGLAGKVNSMIGGVYLGITCGLIQPRGILGVWEGILRRAKL